MSEEDVDKWAREGQSRDLYMSRSCSSFEMLDPHDPVISRLATQLFKKTNDYLQGEMTTGQDYYNLLEEINRLAITKYADLRHLTVNLSKTLNEYNETYISKLLPRYAGFIKMFIFIAKPPTNCKHENIIYNVLIKPLLLQIDQIDAKVSQFEANACRLDSYTKQLKACFKELEEK